MRFESLRGLAIGALGVAVAVGSVRADLPEVPEAAVAELGVTYGEPQMSGFVFIEGRYIPAPYTVTRKGTGIFINRILIEQPLLWSAISGEAVEQPKKLDANGDFEVVAPAAAKPAEGVPAAAKPEEPPAAEPAAPKRVKSIDDLFDDDTPAGGAKPAPAAQPAASPVPATAAAGEPAAVAEAPAAAARSPEEVAKLKQDVRGKLDERRKVYEQALGRGEIYFFGQSHSRLNGNYGTARTLIGVLPDALRYAHSAQDLMRRLNEGGVYFVDMATCAALFKNRLTFPLLDERLKRIEENEALDAARRRAQISR